MLKKIILLLAFTCGSLLAQTPRSLEVRTLCFGYSNRIKDVTLAGDPEGKAVIDCKLKRYLESKQQPLTVLDNQILIGEPGDAGFNTWATVPIEKGLQEVLLVFFPLDNAKKPYQVMAFDDSSKNFPLASFQIANMSNRSLRLIVGEKPIEIKAGGRRLIKEFNNMKKNGQVSYYAYYQDGEDWKRLSSGFWDVVPRKRSLQIAFGNPKTKTVQMRSYEDGLPIVKALQKQQSEAQ
jgi:hypothetical protein